jgi:hypothetical protein
MLEPSRVPAKLGRPMDRFHGEGANKGGRVGTLLYIHTDMILPSVERPTSTDTGRAQEVVALLTSGSGMIRPMTRYDPASGAKQLGFSQQLSASRG